MFDAAMVVANHQARFQQLGDINGDGYMDAFSAWWYDDSYHSLRVSAFLNDGEGQLAKTWTTSLFVNPNHTNTWAFVAGDVNGDGLCDLVGAAGNFAQLYVTGPNGSAPVLITSFATSGAIITGVALLDVDNDGVKEIAVYNGNLQIVRLQGASLVAVAALALGGTGGELRNADVNGDGTGDLIAWDATRLWTIPMQGAQPQAPTGFVHGCGDPRGAAGDIDNDGDEDLVVFDFAQYVVLRRTGPTTYVQEPMAAGGPARFLYDIDGDGSLDGVCCGGGGPSEVHNNAPSIFRLAINDGTGHFGPAIEMPGLGSIRLAGAADLDHDGDLDLVAGRCVFYSPAQLLDNLPHTVPFTPRRNAFSDLDGDKDLDLEPGLVTQRNAGDGGFAPFTPVVPAPPPDRTWSGPGFPGDFDGDGDIDLIVSQSANLSFEHMELLKNAGGGSFVDAGAAGPDGLYFAGSAGTAPKARDALVKDADGDGDLDLVVIGPFSPTKVFWNDGNGFFTVGPTFGFTFTARDVADMNGDGFPDLVGWYKWSSTSYDIAIYAGIGNGQFGNNAYHVYFSGGWTGPTNTFDIGDADGDGDLDIAGFDSNDLYLFQNNGQPGGNLSFQYQLVVDKAVEGGPTGEVHNALFTDFDGDGQLDIVWSPVGWYVFDAPNASGILRRNRGNTGYEAPIFQAMMATAAFDLDGDGDEDLTGTQVFKNRLHENVDGGMRKQVDAGCLPGPGGVTPTLGMSGPFRVGEHAEVVLTGAPGGVQGLWYQHYLGDPPPPFTGGRHQASPSLYYPPLHITTSGSAGEVGTGRWSLQFEVPGYVAGRTKVYHCDLFDSSMPGGTARSNKLYITYGP